MCPRQLVVDQLAEGVGDGSAHALQERLNDAVVELLCFGDIDQRHGADMSALDADPVVSVEPGPRAGYSYFFLRTNINLGSSTALLSLAKLQACLILASSTNVIVIACMCHSSCEATFRTPVQVKWRAFFSMVLAAFLHMVTCPLLSSRILPSRRSGA